MSDARPSAAGQQVGEHAGGSDPAAVDEVGHAPAGAPQPSTADDAAAARRVTAASAPLRLMAVHAHPDDESSKGAASLARYAAEGVGVVVVSCTGGERGDILNKGFLASIGVEVAEGEEPPIDIPSLRLTEMAEAAEVLGVAHEWLGFEDSGYHEGPPESWVLPEGCFGARDAQEETEALVRLVRRYRPQVMTTYDESGGYPHPDHIRCHVVSIAAFEAAGDPDAFPDAGEPWQPSKLYYNVGFSAERMRALNEAAREATGTGPFDEWLARMAENGRPDPGRRTTTRVHVADFFDQRDRALKAHATQIDPEAHWFLLPHEVEARVWATDDYELARSLVDTELPEDDLFAGVREPALVPTADHGALPGR